MPVAEQEPSPENKEPEPGTPDRNTETDVHVNNNNNDEIVIEDEQMITDMKDNIVRKWEVLKKEDMAKRSALPKIKTDKKSKKVIQRANKAIEQIKHSNADFSPTELNQLIYAAATVITYELGLKPRKTTNRKRKQPAWKLKL